MEDATRDTRVMTPDEVADGYRRSSDVFGNTQFGIHS